MSYISPYQSRAKEYALKKGYKLRKLKEGRIKVLRPDKTEIVVHDWIAAHELMMSETIKVDPNKTIFD